MPTAAILCTRCGAASAAALLSQCGKCGGKNARVCAGCGFQNSLAKNYCDKCGSPLSDLGTFIAPPPPTTVPGAPQSDGAIPTTLSKRLGHLKKAAAPGEPPTPSRRLGADRRALSAVLAMAAGIASLAAVWCWRTHVQ